MRCEGCFRYQSLVTLCCGILMLSGALLAFNSGLLKIASNAQHTIEPWENYDAFNSLETRLHPSDAPLSNITDVANLTAWLDPLVSSEMNRTNTAGLTIGIVFNGSILLTRGYGYANLTQALPVDPNATMFRVGSVSKMFTAAAVMQLVERGLLDLHADIREYLDFEFANPYSENITLQRLLTHTAGFEESTIPYYWRLEDQPSLREVLTTDPPAIVYQPGAVVSYSNYGVALAGYIVERVSGLSFPDYVEQNIFTPLSMSRSTFRQTTAEANNASFARGYFVGNEGLIPSGFPFVGLSPAGALASTAEDMGKWMLMLLQNGTYGGHTVLENSSVQTMSSGQYPCPAFVEQVGFGLFQDQINNVAIIGHNGAVGPFMTQLNLIPENKFGFFISVSTPNGFVISNEVFTKIREEYFGMVQMNSAPPVPMPNSTAHIPAVVGTYVVSRRVSTTIMVLSYLGGGIFSFDISSNPNGTIQVFDRALVEVAPYVYSDVTGAPYHVVFIPDENGKIQYMYIGSPVNSFEKLDWYETAPFHLALIVASFGFLIASLLGWLVGIVRRKIIKGPPLDGHVRNARLIYLGYFASNLAGIGIMYYVLSGYIVNLTIPGITGYLGISRAFFIAGMVLYVGIIIQAIWLWKQNRAKTQETPRKKIIFLGNLWYSIGIIMGLLATYEIFYWKLLFF